MAKISFMERLTLGIVVAVILFGVSFTFMTGITTGVNGIATYYTYSVPTVINGTVQYYPVQAKPPFAQPFWELTLSFAIGFLPIAIVIWDNHKAKETEATTCTLNVTDIKSLVEQAISAVLPGALAKATIEAQTSKRTPDGPPGSTIK